MRAPCRTAIAAAGVGAGGGGRQQPLAGDGLYPGKLTTLETFRVGCMGQLGPRGMAGAVEAVAEALIELGLAVEAQVA